jgi:catechol 2,3-dioxygenase-like lactoylglutathione lyase family enzyme
MLANDTPLWPAGLDHIRLDSPDPAALAAFYGRTMGMAARPLAEGAFLAEGPERRLVIGPGARNAQPFAAFALQDAAHLARYRDWVRGRGVEALPSPSPLFASGDFAVRDPDGRLAVFGVRPPPAGGMGLPGRLEHVVVASARFGEMRRFYEEALGFLVSDTVLSEKGETNVAFFRADREHHSLAVFRAPTSRGDHHAYETTGWNDLKLWADHLASHDVAIWWGPGRHGAGNNLFFMVKDPDGNNIEISAELERLERDQPGKAWPPGGKALNLWGAAWVRDAASS